MFAPEIQMPVSPVKCPSYFLAGPYAERLAGDDARSVPKKIADRHGANDNSRLISAQPGNKAISLVSEHGYVCRDTEFSSNAPRWFFVPSFYFRGSLNI